MNSDAKPATGLFIEMGRVQNTEESPNLAVSASRGAVTITASERIG